MYPDMPQLGRETRVMAVEAGGGAVRRGMHRAGKRSHLVATRASLSMLRGVVVRRTIDKRDAQSRGGRDEKASEFKDAHHERNAVPFQLLSSDAEA
jgi:hypothetical protein